MKTSLFLVLVVVSASIVHGATDTLSNELVDAISRAKEIVVQDKVQTAAFEDAVRSLEQEGTELSSQKNVVRQPGAPEATQLDLTSNSYDTDKVQAQSTPDDVTTTSKSLNTQAGNVPVSVVTVVKGESSSPPVLAEPTAAVPPPGQADLVANILGANISADNNADAETTLSDWANEAQKSADASQAHQVKADEGLEAAETAYRTYLDHTRQAKEHEKQSREHKVEATQHAKQAVVLGQKGQIQEQAAQMLHMAANRYEQRSKVELVKASKLKELSQEKTALAKKNEDLRNGEASKGWALMNAAKAKKKDADSEAKFAVGFNQEVALLHSTIAANTANASAALASATRQNAAAAALETKAEALQKQAGELKKKAEQAQRFGVQARETAKGLQANATKLYDLYRSSKAKAQTLNEKTFELYRQSQMANDEAARLNNLATSYKGQAHERQETANQREDVADQLKDKALHERTMASELDSLVKEKVAEANQLKGDSEKAYAHHQRAKDLLKDLLTKAKETLKAAAVAFRSSKQERGRAREYQQAAQQKHAAAELSKQRAKQLRLRAQDNLRVAHQAKEKAEKHQELAEQQQADADQRRQGANLSRMQAAELMKQAQTLKTNAQTYEKNYDLYHTQATQATEATDRIQLKLHEAVDSKNQKDELAAEADRRAVFDRKLMQYWQAKAKAASKQAIDEDAIARKSTVTSRVEQAVQANAPPAVVAASTTATTATTATTVASTTPVAKETTPATPATARFEETDTDLPTDLSHIPLPSNAFSEGDGDLDHTVPADDHFNSPDLEEQPVSMDSDMAKEVKDAMKDAANDQDALGPPPADTELPQSISSSNAKQQPLNCDTARQRCMSSQFADTEACDVASQDRCHV